MTVDGAMIAPSLDMNGTLSQQRARWFRFIDTSVKRLRGNVTRLRIKGSYKHSRPRDRDRKDHSMPLTNRREGG